MQIPSYLVNHHYDDRYFDVVDAISEAKQVFFKGCDLQEMLRSGNSTSSKIVIGETGFGTGRILVALIDYINNLQCKDVAIVYNSVELHPLPYQHIKSVLDQLDSTLQPLIALYLDSYRTIDISNKGWNSTTIQCDFGVITLNLWIGEALEMVHALESPCDAWFLDGHGPKKNPAMWREELLLSIGEKTRLNGTIATYTVAGAVKRGLTAAGFSIEKVPGCGGKKEALRGVKTH